MSVENTAVDSIESVNNEAQSQYTETNKMSYASQSDVTEAWAAGKYPTHNVGENGAILYTGRPQSAESRSVRGDETNFYGVQHPDGSGTLWHYNTREAIRLSDGTIIDNEQCWCSGFAHCSPPTEERDLKLPLDALESFLDDGDSLEDIEEVRGQPEYNYSNFHDELRAKHNVPQTIVVINGSESRYGVYLGRDKSIIDGPDTFAFRLAEYEVDAVPETALDEATTIFLQPEEVRSSYKQVVDSKEYTKTDLDEIEQHLHEDRGGKLKENNSYYGPDKKNYQSYRANLLGTHIIRHGEFFFIPSNRDLDPEEIGSEYAREQMGNHSPGRSGTNGVRSPLPTECPVCDEQNIHIDEDGATSCNHCGTDIEREIYVRGTVKHNDGDHNMVNLKEQWHKVVSHERDVLVYDNNPTGSGRRRYERGRTTVRRE